MIAPRLALACVLTAALVPTVVTAQHAKESKEDTKSTRATAKETAAEHAAPAKHEAEAASKSTAKDTAREGARSERSKTSAAAHEEEAVSKTEHGEKKTGGSAREGTRSAKAEAAESDKEEKESESPKGKPGTALRSKAAKNEPKNELEAALKRIDEQITVMRAKPEAADARSASRSRAEARPARVVPAAAPAPRIHLSWRTTLLWTNDLDGEGAAVAETPHVGLVWTPEPIAARPVAPLVR